MASDGRPAQPKTILRGHKVQVHAAVFCRHNERLLTGDADGFVVAWDLTIMRPRAVWRAHTNSILGIAAWGSDRIITHGRDNRLVVWKLAAEDEGTMSTQLPLDPSPKSRPQPWMLHLLEVNTMNFCSFSWCQLSNDEILVAVPNTLASEAIDVFQLPTQNRLHTVKLGDKNGMVMALSLFHLSHVLTLVAGYENGLAVVAQLNSQGGWETRYQTKSHSQPILSLDVSPQGDFFLTSSADAAIAKHPLPAGSTPNQKMEKEHSDSAELTTGESAEAESKDERGMSLLSAAVAREMNDRTPQRAMEGEIQTEPLKVINTKHSGQQSVKIRSDGRIFATAGWDSKTRVYSAKSMREVAVLSWHQVGCYTAAFAEVQDADGTQSGRLEPELGSITDHQTAGEAPMPPVEVNSVVPRLVEVSLREKRANQARSAHWLASGSKDGKISLWDIF